MAKEKFLYPFSQCITNQSPCVSHGSEDFIVIYAVEDHDISYHEDSIIFGYLNAAERLIQSLYSRDHAGNKPHAGDDRISLPLLHLYSHALELSLKSTITTISNHATICQRINNIQDTIEKTLSSHSLGALVDALIKIIPNDKNNQHFFKEFEAIAEFIKEFDQYGVDSISTRYILQKRKQQKHEIYKKQSFLIPRNMHENVKTILYSLADYIEGSHLWLCQNGDFSQKKIDELNSVLSTMKKYEEIFSNYKRDHDKYPYDVDSHHIIIWDEKTLNSCRKQNKLAIDLINKISTLDNNEIAQLVLGLNFADGINSWKLKSIKKICIEENIDTIERYALSYREATKILCDHIDYLKRYLLT